MTVRRPQNKYINLNINALNHNNTYIQQKTALHHNSIFYIYLTIDLNKTASQFSSTWLAYNKNKAIDEAKNVEYD